uniref:RING-type domain-containing protein n=1 Tax=Chromera velia CCMP2878 TaxID=1169474 RepID=A0A0G4H625_9ALVE|eukprot:Cvel_24838.t1-p1 / transcript=Cvel_24838.t1 / gene=Cvel_24838 / organism=Chromera_velia_CCMP2878 / gene_product=LON peptidase N-terminal domain and RING finger, putative / transcript_product=LON peptidase N-terminal domain and RING finger, putative / location=Cvel_scaffold2740:6957-8636(+) / protein_length=560 / sequence_SO=supercontig / SO=protein_coding / is_pseudo=false
MTEADAPDPELICSICLEVFYEPLTLHCSHSFCRACLLQSSKLAPDGRSCPQCRALIPNITDPILHPVDENIAERVASAVSSEVLEKRKEQQSEALASVLQKSANTVPVFIMKPSAPESMVPGAPVAFNFFETRYKILVRRAWEGDRQFLWAASESKQGSPLQEALLVSIDDALFKPDGRASIRGHGVALVSLNPKNCFVEDGTGGLWYARLGTEQRNTRRQSDVPPRPSSSVNPQGQAQTSRAISTRLTTVEYRWLERTSAAMERAISEGAPAYNRGQVRRCAEVYLRTAREALLALPASGRGANEGGGLSNVSTRLETTVMRVERLLATGRQRDADTAAWELRHLFDALILIQAAAARERGDTSVRNTPSENAEEEVAGRTGELENDLPVFCYNGLTVRPGESKSFTWFEPRYRSLAVMLESRGQTAGSSDTLRERLILCASASEAPSTGQIATLARVTDCRIEGGEGGASTSSDSNTRAKVTLVGVRRVRIGRVWRDSERGGLAWAVVDQGGSRGVDGDDSVGRDQTLRGGRDRNAVGGGDGTRQSKCADCIVCLIQ